MTLYSKIFNISRNDVISIVGFGGKTTLMFSISEQLRKSKTLITTSTKIYMPKQNYFDYNIIGIDDLDVFRNFNKKGIYILGEYINGYGKVCANKIDFLNNISKFFDYTIIESDGSKMKDLKAWKTTEPVIIENTTKTIGVISIKLIGAKINNTNIHNLSEFLKLTNSKINEIITFKHIKEIIINKEGLFKNSIGKKILFINKIDNKYDMLNVYKFLDIFTNKQLMIFDKVVFGSLKEELLYEYNRYCNGFRA